ncbi:dynein axonemal intermediate chain 7 isoform X2 [Narcine bancroftii]|uniref:dynein axonemal intermediate chain 7 isoform X2 n=1 Tax=Narcine bancroftii TaxID=1343680 RepID=UPI003831AE05
MGPLPASPTAPRMLRPALSPLHPQHSLERLHHQHRSTRDGKGRQHRIHAAEDPTALGRSRLQNGGPSPSQDRVIWRPFHWPPRRRCTKEEAPKEKKKKKRGKRETSVQSSAVSKKGQRPSRSAEKLVKQEEEKKRLEEEELRVAAERLEREILEQKRLEEEERERITAEDKARKDNEQPELIQILQRNMAYVQRSCRNLIEWQRYMKCDGTPDPTIPQEINTFINLSREDLNIDIRSLFERSRIILRLLDELEMLLRDTPSDELLEETVAQYEQTILDLQTLLSNINDKATDILLQKAVDLVDIETGNMQEEVNDENITLCLWANFNKNPRFKGYQFVNNNVEFELPRPLAMCDIAVRILHTQYDHISCHIPLFQAHQRMFKNKPVIFEVKEDQEEKDQDQEATEVQNPIEEQNLIEAKHAFEMKLKIEETKSLRPMRTRSALSTSSNREIRRPRTPNDDRVLDQFANAEFIEAIPSTKAIDDHIVVFNQFTPVGGVYYFDVLKLPPQPKFVNVWRIVQLSETGLQAFPYPMESVKESMTSLGNLDEKEGENHPVPSVGITIKLPPRALFFEQPKPARWDATGVQWRTDGIHNVTFEAETKLLSFKMDTFNTFTLIQRNYVNMPFQSWEIKPVAENEALLTVVAALTTVEIRIKDLCQLCPVSVEDNLSHIRGKWMRPSTLIISMINAGLNIFPGNESEKYVKKANKDKQLEQETYIQMALLTSAMAFRWSKWNLHCEQEEIVLQGYENVSGKTIAEDSWFLYLLRPERSQRLKMKESDEEWTKEIFENTDLYSNLYHMVKGQASEAAQDRILNTDYLFFMNTNEILQATKLLTHTMQVN